MFRLLIQSRSSGRFLAPDMETGSIDWVTRLDRAGGGVVSDIESAHQLIEDHTDLEDEAVVIDLDRLGTAFDYTEI